jgi:hypothetical protein
MSRLPFLFALVLASPVLGLPADAADDPLTRIVPKAESACFRRDYDAAHMKSHRAQAVSGMLVSLKRETDPNMQGVAIRVAFRRNGETLYAWGGCAWSESASRDIRGQRLIKEFKGDGAADCMATVAPSSAEEGGDFVISPDPGGRTLLVYLDSGLRLHRGTSGRWTTPFIEFGKDDRVFRLDRTDAAACKALDALVE